MPARLSPDIRAIIRSEMAGAGHGVRTAIAARLAALYGVSVGTIYRHAGRGGSKRPRVPHRPEYRAWTMTAVALAAKKTGRPLPLELALKAGIESGLLPTEAADMPLSTAHRLAREMKINPRPARTRRLYADYPMQAVQIDGSSSQYLVVDSAIGDDWLLRLHNKPTPASGYKNKPLGPDRMRVLVYAIWDMCTGYSWARYCVARGESSLDALNFLCAAMADKASPDIPLKGVPDDLWSDQGPLFKSAAARDLLERLNINLVTGAPYAKTRMGGVERTHRTRWERFEGSLFLRGQNTITLSELNTRLDTFTVEENKRRAGRTPLPDGRLVSRHDSFIALLNGRARPVRALPDNPLKTLFEQSERHVDANGIIRWDGVAYQLERLHNCRVTARRPVAADADYLTVEDADGNTHTAVPIQQRHYGHVPTFPQSPRERLLASDTLKDSQGTDIYQPVHTGSNVTPMRPRQAPAATLDNPLAGEQAYSDIDAAMAAFQAIYPYPLGPANHALVRTRLLESGLDKNAARALAQELINLSTNPKRETRI